MKRPNNTTYVSIMLSVDEKAWLDEAVKASGKSRNRFLRDFIATLRKK